jgi:hypothetical protein
MVVAMALVTVRPVAEAQTERIGSSIDVSVRAKGKRTAREGRKKRRAGRARTGSPAPSVAEPWSESAEAVATGRAA